MAGGRQKLIIGGLCGKGHLLTEKNTRIRKGGGLYCADCQSERADRMREENRRLRKLADERNERKWRMSAASE